MAPTTRMTTAGTERGSTEVKHAGHSRKMKVRVCVGVTDKRSVRETVHNFFSHVPKIIETLIMRKFTRA